jgi:CBS domain-containing protein
MKVQSILKSKGGDVVTVAPDAAILDIADTLKQKGIGAVVVLGPGDAVAGILSERDIVRGLAEHGAKLSGKRASDLMTREVKTCTPDHSVDDLMKIMTEGRFRHVPVVDRGRLAGVISIGDVVKNRLDELEAETGALRSYIATG